MPTALNDILNGDEFREFDCELCGSGDAVELEFARSYTDGQPIHVCRNCGFVYVRRRRSAQRIAEAWNVELFQNVYTARIPAVVARQVYVAETIETTIGVKGKSLCDIGGGEGQFLDLLRQQGCGPEGFAIEPSPANCRKMSKAGIECFTGTVEDFVASPAGRDRRFDIVTIMWTLENCQSCRTMLDGAYAILADGGHIVVATGSRILVPFKKPLNSYFSKNAADTHCFRFSRNTLGGLLAVSGFRTEHVNRYLDSDILLMIARKTDRSEPLPWTKDRWREVVDFFRRWDRETRAHYLGIETDA